jgi:hypothetical protein
MLVADYAKPEVKGMFRQRDMDEAAEFNIYIHSHDHLSTTPSIAPSSNTTNIIRRSNHATRLLITHPPYPPLNQNQKKRKQATWKQKMGTQTKVILMKEIHPYTRYPNPKSNHPPNPNRATITANCQGMKYETRKEGDKI